MAEAQTLVADGVTIDDESKPSWFTRLIGFYLKRRSPRALADAQTAKGHEAIEPANELPHSARDFAERATTIACIKSAISGALAGSAVTAATVVAAQTEGLGAIVTAPLAGLAVGGELLYRSVLHLDLACDVASSFGITFDPDDPHDLWQIYGLVFKTTDAGDDEPEPVQSGRKVIEELVGEEGEKIGEELGRKMLGESIARNLLPVVGIVSSAVTNYVLTKRLGNAVRRYARYRRAFDDAFAHAAADCKHSFELLVEGVWYLFTADGHLSPEEAVTLTRMLRQLPADAQARVRANFDEDEMDWCKRIEVIDEAHRDAFLHALAVAAAVDKHAGLPERKILRRAADHLNRPFDMKQVEMMIAELESYGLLRGAARTSVVGVSD